MKKIVVMSGINIVSGGMLAVFKDCLKELLAYGKEYKIIALVHRKNLFEGIVGNIEFIEFPRAKKSWFIRCYYEYMHFYWLSKKFKPYFWLSMHDMTPNVEAKYQAVYCHNPSPFFDMRLKEYFVDWKITLFVLFYRYLYRINIHKNKYIVVQQQWLRKEFQNLYNVDNVVVAHPKINFLELKKEYKDNNAFIYPTLPRMYKNIEIVCEAARMLTDLELKIYITIDGTENAYAKKIVSTYEAVKGIYFIGLQSRERIFEYYNNVRGLIFPSRLESWGMPLSEFAVTEKLILAADLQYAHEVLNGYKNVKFFDVNNSSQWADCIRNLLVKNEFISDDTRGVIDKSSLYAENWQDLFKILLKEEVEE